MLLTKSDEKTNSVITIGQTGIYYQELMTVDRKQSPRVRLGELALVDGDILPNFTEWDEFNDLTVDRRSAETELKVLTSLILDGYKALGIESDSVSDDATVAETYKTLIKTCHPDKAENEEQKIEFEAKTRELNHLRDNLKALHKKHLNLQVSIKHLDSALREHPIAKLSTLSGKVHERVNKLITSASFKNKFRITTKGIAFLPIQTLEHFLESQAKDLLRRHNEKYELLGLESGFLDIETARDIIAKRFDRASKRLPTAYSL